MSNDDFELRRIAWAEAFPFVRLFRTFKLAIHGWQLLLGLACILGCYVGGRILDGIWVGLGSGAAIAPDTGLTEVDAFATQNRTEFASWKQGTATGRQQLIAKAAVALGLATSANVALPQVATRPAREFTTSDKHRKELAEALDIVEARVKLMLASVETEKDETLTAHDKKQRRRDIRRAADYLRLLLTGHDVRDFGSPTDPMAAILTLSTGGEPMTPEQRAVLARVVPAQAAVNEVGRSDSRGPFRTLLSYEMRCFAGAIRGVCTFRWGFGGGPHEAEPSLLGSIVAAGSGVAWLVTQRPCFAVFYALWHFAVFAFFGGAICRHAAVQAARDESLSLGETLRFAWEKYASLLLAPLAPAGLFVLVAFALWAGGLIAAIPWIGELFAGVLYGLALLAGFALAMILIATVLGLHLMWPTLAVEGSDALDAVTHALGYIGQRAWNTGFYSLVLLIYGGVSFVMVRVIGVLVLKLTHLCTGAGMSWFGTWTSSHTSTFSKLNAMWQMPSWGDLSLLPTTSHVPFWGTFANAPLNGSEWLAMWLIRCWVYLVVGLVGAFVVNFFLCGSTQMYFLLRRDVDGVDYDEIYYVEPEEAPPLEETVPETPAAPAPPADPATPA